jgi:predicted ATPase
MVGDDGAFGELLRHFRRAAGMSQETLARRAGISPAPLPDARLVAPTVAQALGLPGAGRRPAADRLLTYLADRDMLLVLDSFEHLLQAAQLIAELIARCPALSVIVTSRAPLRLRTEEQLRVPPLVVPPAAETQLSVLAANPAIQLFAARSRAVRPDFAIRTGRSARSSGDMPAPGRAAAGHRTRRSAHQRAGTGGAGRLSRHEPGPGR